MDDFGEFLVGGFFWLLIICFFAGFVIEIFDACNKNVSKPASVISQPNVSDIYRKCTYTFTDINLSSSDKKDLILQCVKNSMGKSNG